MRMNEQDAENLYSELVALFHDWETILARNRAAVVRWRFANYNADPLGPSGPLDKVDFDLWQCQGFVRGTRSFSDSYSKKCFYKLGYDSKDHVRLSEGGCPMAWEYDGNVTTCFNLSEPFSRASFERAWMEESRLLRRIQAGDTFVTERFFDYVDNLICCVREYIWERVDSRYLEFDSRVHNIIYNYRGQVKKIESICCKNGREGCRGTTNVRHPLLP